MPSSPDTAADALRLRVLRALPGGAGLSPAFPAPSLPFAAVTAVLFTCAGQRVDIVTAFADAGATTSPPTSTDSRRRSTTPMPTRSCRASTTPATSARLAELVARARRPARRPADRPRPGAARPRARRARTRRSCSCPPPRSCDDDARQVHARTSFFEEHGIAEPAQLAARGEVPDDARFPLLVKTREGFGSRHIYRAADPRRARVLPPLHDRRLVRAGALPRARSSRSTSSATSTAAA